ncbi:MAG: tRNA pseudouridine(38-40) synthase TruA [Rhodospirillales bacterium]|jgi:tRNA pseudouridine38-40 synthase|nr:tRNA pseudouridine(38-40) synthase TruA [Rhodospirillales bacterium]
MPRYKLLLEYNGGPFVGWQRQDNGLSVQAALEQAVLGYCGERVIVHGAGRTDAGVHAKGQVAHLDLGREAPAKTVRDAINFHLRPHPIVVLAAEPVDDGFHARFSAKQRRYLYRILSRQSPPALERGRAWWVPVRLDVEAMAGAAAGLIGRHDLSTFRAALCQATSPVKTIDDLVVKRHGEAVVIEIGARSFLHHQVRNITGSLSLVGRGKWSQADFAAAFAARDRRRGGPTAPACGLYLVAVSYS